MSKLSKIKALAMMSLACVGMCGVSLGAERLSGLSNDDLVRDALYYGGAWISGYATEAGQNAKDLLVGDAKLPFEKFKLAAEEIVDPSTGEKENAHFVPTINELFLRLERADQAEKRLTDLQQRYDDSGVEISRLQSQVTALHEQLSKSDLADERVSASEGRTRRGFGAVSASEDQRVSTPAVPQLQAAPAAPVAERRRGFGAVSASEDQRVSTPAVPQSQAAPAAARKRGFN